MALITIRPQGEDQPITLNTAQIRRTRLCEATGRTIIETLDGERYFITEKQVDFQDRANRAEAGDPTAARS